MLYICIFLPVFITRSLQPVAQVDVGGEHSQGRWLECDFFAPVLHVLRPAEGAFLEPLGDHPVAGAIKVEFLIRLRRRLVNRNAALLLGSMPMVLRAREESPLKDLRMRRV